METTDGAESGSSTLRARWDRALIALFLAVLAAPTVDEFVRAPAARGPEAAELRPAAKRPDLYADPRTIKHFPRQYEDWHKDTFGLRDVLLRQRSIVRLFVFGVSPTDEIELGRDGWMFFTGNASRSVHRGRLPFQPHELERWQAMIENHAESCEDRGIAHVLAIGPNKQTVYPEMAPEHWAPVGPTRLEQLDAWSKERGATARFLDLRPALRAEKVNDAPGDHVYYELGTHWNGRGVYVAYHAILAALAERIPSLAPRPFTDFGRNLGDDSGDSWARSMYVDDLIPQKNHVILQSLTRTQQYEERGVSVFVSESENTKAPRALMVHDSFGQSILFQLAPHFSRLAAYWTPKLTDELIERERPDVIIELYVERYLVSFDPRESMLGKGQFSRGLFERSTATAFELGAANAGRFEGRFGARVTATEAPASLRIELTDAKAYVVLPEFAPPADGDLLARIELDSEHAGKALLLPVWHGETEPRRRQYGSSSFPAGESTVYVRIPESEKLARLALRFILDEGVVLVRSLEVRGMPRR